MPPATPICPEADQLATLRAFAAQPGALFYVLVTDAGRALVWAGDINATNNDDELRALVARCVG